MSFPIKMQRNIQLDQNWEILKADIFSNYVKDVNSMPIPSDKCIKLMYSAFFERNSSSVKLNSGQVIKLIKDRLYYRPFFEILAVSLSEFSKFFPYACYGYYYKNKTLSDLADYISTKYVEADEYFELEAMFTSYIADNSILSDELNTNCIIGNESNIFNIDTDLELIYDERFYESTAIEIFEGFRLHLIGNTIDVKEVEDTDLVYRISHVLYKYVDLNLNQQKFILNILKPYYIALRDEDTIPVKPYYSKYILALVAYYSKRQKIDYTYNALLEWGIFHMKPEDSVLSVLVNVINRNDLVNFYTHLIDINENNVELFAYSFLHAGVSYNEYDKKDIIDKNQVLNAHDIAYLPYTMELIDDDIEDDGEVLPRKYAIYNKTYAKCIALRFKDMVIENLGSEVIYLRNYTNFNEIIRQFSNKTKIVELMSILSEVLGDDKTTNVLKMMVKIIKMELSHYYKFDRL